MRHSHLSISSQFLLTALVAATVSGCGGGSGSGQPLQRSSQISGSGALANGNCGDTVGIPAAKEIRAFSEVSSNGGTFELLSFQAVATKRYDVEASSREGIAMIQGTTTSGGAIEVSAVCENLDQLPNESVELRIAAPAGIRAKDGIIAENLIAQQIVYGRSVMDPSGNRRVSPPSSPVSRATECTSVEASLSGQNCEGTTQYFELDRGQIGVLRTIETRDLSGAIVTNKIYATYSLGGVRTSDPVPTDEPMPGPGIPSGGSPGQGGKKKSNGNGKPSQGGKIGQGGNLGNGGTPGQGGKIGQGGNKNSNGGTLVIAPTQIPNYVILPEGASLPSQLPARTPVILSQLPAQPPVVITVSSPTPPPVVVTAPSVPASPGPGVKEKYKYKSKEDGTKTKIKVKIK